MKTGINLSIDTNKINEMAQLYKGLEREVAEAAYHALNRTIDQVVTQVGRIVPKEYAIKSTEVKKTFKGNIKKPTRSNLEATATSVGRKLTLAHFPFTPSKPQNNNYVIKATIKKSDGKKKINTNPNPFVLHTGAKSKEKVQFNVFKRKGKARFPIEPIKVIGIPEMIDNKEVGKQINDFALMKLDERLQHEILRAMKNVGGK